MGDQGSKKLLKGALILTVAGLASKVLSASYRIPLQNLTGDIGFYIYQQVYPIVGIVIVLSLYGFPQAISKVTAELADKHKPVSIKHVALPIFFILSFICSVFFLLLYLGAERIAHWVGDPHLEHSYQTVACTFLFIPLLALFRGILQGKGYMQATAYSQIGEQLIRVCMIVFVAWFVAAGKMDIYTIGQTAGIAAMAGLSIATVIVACFIIKRKPFRQSSFSIPWKYYIKMMLTLGLVASLNHMVLLVMQVADTFTLIPSLMEYGYSKLDAMEQKGVFDRGQPLIQLGAVLGSSFALALVPSVSRRKMKEAPRVLYEQVHGALLVSFYIGVGAVVGLIALFPEVNELLYQNTKGTRELQILSLSIFLCSLSITCASILQGFGYSVRTACYICIAFFIKWAINILLIPHIGITGGALGTVIALCALFIMVYMELKRKLPYLYVHKLINLRTLIITSFFMISFIALMKLFLLQFVENRLALLIFVSITVIVGAIIFIFTLIRGRAFTKQELEMLPFASKLIHIHKER